MNERFLAVHRGKIVWLVIITVAVLAFIFLRGGEESIRIHRPGDGSPVPVAFVEGSYAGFLHEHANTPLGTVAVDIDIFNPTYGRNYEVLTNFEGEARVLRAEEDSYVEFTVNVPSAGMFNIVIEYFPVAARGIDITREVRINGEVPFTGAELITLPRVWGSAGEIRQDGVGNDIRPPQVEFPRWERTYFDDRLGFFTEPYRFFFEAGENTISFSGMTEPLVIRRLTLEPVRTLPTFAEFMAENTLPINTSNFGVRVQGEESTVRSSPSLFPLFDSSSGATDPPSVALVSLNMIGGVPWRIPGQWIEWEVYVPADGLYTIALSARQNYNRGMVSSRQVTVNGVVPFREVAAVPFGFENRWQFGNLQDDYGNDLLFPMNAGINTIRMYVTLGDFGEILESLLSSVMRLNEVYRTILVLTGRNPDPLRDYRVHHHLPEVMYMIYDELDILYGLLRQMEEFLGERSEHTGVVQTLVRQLDVFHARPERIPMQFARFQHNISAMADATRLLTESPLDIDFMYVAGTGFNLPDINQGFFINASHEVRAFFTSFFHDFDTVGEGLHAGGDRQIEVWFPAGRDQATAMMSMIEDTFTPETGINVHMRLVDPAAILRAVVAGTGPDIVLSMGRNTAVEYAFRNAVTDLSVMPGFDEVRERFHPSAWVQLGFTNRYGVSGYFGIPETQGFQVMFYRHDILEDLGLSAPTTWDDVIAMMPILQRNNMEIGIPGVGDPMAPDIGGFLVQLYQRGGFLYNREGDFQPGHPHYGADLLSRAFMDSEAAIDAFEAYTRFFTHFGSPQFFNFPNRFRAGEMPIGFADFGMFNMLSVFAPEIYGLWNFAIMPGFDHGRPVYFPGQGYQQVHHTVHEFGNAAMIIQQSENKELAWEFLKWWTDAPTQLRFAREMESVMGAAARFPTANLEAFQSLPWTTQQLAVITDQREWTLGTPEVPGGYYVGRHIMNAIRRVVNERVDTRETLLDFNIVINRELINKRREFGLE